MIPDLIVEAGDWPAEKELAVLAQAALGAVIVEIDLDLPKDAEVSIVFADDATVQNLNRDWRDKDQPTNVLSFAANDGLPPAQWYPLLGDIVLACETVAREASAENKGFDAHLTHLIIHGFLHLLGYDHENDVDAEHMERTECAALSRLGIADPYLEP